MTLAKATRYTKITLISLQFTINPRQFFFYWIIFRPKKKATQTTDLNKKLYIFMYEQFLLVMLQHLNAILSEVLVCLCSKSPISWQQLLAFTRQIRHISPAKRTFIQGYCKIIENKFNKNGPDSKIFETFSNIIYVLIFF